MPRKQNRSYKKGEPFRDSRLFVIATEGAKREVSYFEYLVRENQRIKVKVLSPGGSEENKSSPKWVLDRASRFVEEFGLAENDQLWLVIDVDRWPEETLHELGKECLKVKSWNLAISNPCFEVWLMLHYFEIDKSDVKTCSELKTLLGSKINGGYTVEVAARNVEKAIIRAKKDDSNREHYYCNSMESKVYKLVSQLVDFRKV